LGISRAKTELSVSYIDHNTLKMDNKNADDHVYLQSVAAKYGLTLSKAGNGICHQVHLERFAKPGKTLLGSDSHTPTAGGVGSIAIGAGGLDVALAIGGNAFFLKTPHVIGVKLTGKLQPMVAAKDVILEVLRRIMALALKPSRYQSGQPLQTWEQKQVLQPQSFPLMRLPWNSLKVLAVKRIG